MSDKKQWVVVYNFTPSNRPPSCHEPKVLIFEHPDPETDDIINAIGKHSGLVTNGSHIISVTPATQTFKPYTPLAEFADRPLVPQGVHLDTFLAEAYKTVDGFGPWWAENAERSPDDFPMVMPNLEDWWEQLMFYTPEEDRHDD